MNIEYLDLVLSAAFTLRKVRKISLEQGEESYNLRPQIHPFIVAPFGCGKSSITRFLLKKFPESIYTIDSFTKASIEGSIDENNNYVPSVLQHCGGKMFIIDEWNSVDFYAQTSLLSVLENQKVEKVLGRKSDKLYKSEDSEYSKWSVEENVIKGEVLFSCLAHAMEYPISENSQKSKALLSRFSPLFIEPSIEFIKDLTMGNLKITLSTQENIIEEVIITRECQMEVSEKFMKYVEDHNLIPLDSDDLGFISRTQSELTRYGVYNYIKLNADECQKSKKIIIKDPKYFLEMIDYTYTLLLNLNHPKTKGRVYQYQQLLKVEPDQALSYYAKKLGVSNTTIINYNKKLENS